MAIDDQVFSASSVNTYNRCGKQWEFAYVYGIKSPPSIRAVIGIAAHEAVEVNYRQKMTSGVDLPVSDVLDAFSDAFDRVVETAVPDEKETPASGKDSGIKTVDLYHREVASTVHPVLVEEQVQFKVNGVPFSGYIDLVDTRRQIRDLKTVKSKPNRSDYSFNMIGYAIGYRQATGEVESGVQLDYVVRTKEPYYHPVPSDGPIPDSAVEAFANVVTGVADAVQKGVFLPTGLNTGACSWCGYREMCKPYKDTMG